MIKRLRQVQPFWYIVLAAFLVMTAVYAHHLTTHQTPDRVAFSLPVGGFAVYWYGVLIVSGIVLGAYTVTFEIKRRGLDPDHVWGGLSWAIVLAVIGARLYHVLTPPPSMCETVGICNALDYLKDPVRVIDIRQGGLGIYGAIVGALVALYLYGRRYKIDWLAYADVGSYGLALGQFVGRWGNFINQELYGKPTDVPWAVYIEYPSPLYSGTHTFHPAFLYESLWNLLTFLVLYTLATRRREQFLRGELLGFYLILYSVGRIILETVRLDSPNFFFRGADTGVNIAMAFAAVLIALTAGVLLWRRRNIGKSQAG